MITQPQTETGVPETDSWTGDRPPDSALFFSSPDHDRLLELIRHLAENTDNVILVTGEDGAGKSTLLYRLQADLPEQWLFCRMDANPLMHADQLLGNLARRLQTAPGGEQTPARIAAALSALRLQGRTPLVMVDDADQLPMSALMALLRLHEQHEGPEADFILLLVAHPCIEATLDSHQLHAMGTTGFNRLELPTLPLELTKDYVSHYLRLEDISDNIHFSSEQLARIHRHGNGLPGKINEQVVRALNEPQPRAVRLKLPGTFKLPPWLTVLPPLTLLATLTIGLLLAATLVFQDAINDLFEPPREAHGDSPATKPQPLPAEPQPEAGPRQVPTPPLAEPLVAERSEPPPVAPQNEDVFVDEPLIPPPTKGIATTPEARSEHEPKPEPAVDTRPAPAARSALRPDEQWLMRQNPEKYSLQILASTDEAAVKRYLARTRLPDRLMYHESIRDGQPWFHVMLGSYPSRDAAAEALQGLPAHARQAGAWPRKLEYVQEEIQQRIQAR